MIAYRIVKRRYSQRDDVLSGEGAKERGGRWNNPGLPLVYASENRSLAMLEVLLQVSLGDLPGSLVMVGITIPDDARIARIIEADLPSNWREIRNAKCAELGSKWIESKSSLVLRVPSSANPYEENVLINPAHPDIHRCVVSPPTPVQFDPRLEALISKA